MWLSLLFVDDVLLRDSSRTVLEPFKLIGEKNVSDILSPVARESFFYFCGQRTNLRISFRPYVDLDAVAGGPISTESMQRRPRNLIVGNCREGYVLRKNLRVYANTG